MSNFSAPHVKLSDAGSTIHFSHANGYPPLCYKGLLSPFMRDYRLIASLHRPLWPQFAEPSSMNPPKMESSPPARLAQLEGVHFTDGE